MNDTVIEVNKLGKLYRINQGRSAPYRTLREGLSDALAAPFKRLLNTFQGTRKPEFKSRSKRLDTDHIWALKDISFDIRRGEVVGVIGRNGAGKSTLLKVLSRITEPTEGSANIIGRVGSLLEVGTGFHPELTARENVYLNGAILGMPRTEINRKFDEIVSFAEVVDFIDTPVKHYSSGMYLRLAFAVAAHLDPEIMIVDEVLAVGDASFQKKCLGKMSEVSKQGRTVLFVSHNIGAIENLCESAMWIDQGRLRAKGETTAIVGQYLQSNISAHQDPTSWNRSGVGDARVAEVKLLDGDNRPADTFRMGDTIVVDFSVNLTKSFDTINLSVEVKRAETGLPVLHLINQDAGLVPNTRNIERARFRVEVPNCMLYPGAYTVSFWIGGHHQYQDTVHDVLMFSVVQSRVSRRTTPFYPHLGVIHHESRWEQTPIHEACSTATFPNG